MIPCSLPKALALIPVLCIATAFGLPVATHAHPPLAIGSGKAVVRGYQSILVPDGLRWACAAQPERTRAAATSFWDWPRRGEPSAESGLVDIEAYRGLPVDRIKGQPRRTVGRTNPGVRPSITNGQVCRQALGEPPTAAGWGFASHSPSWPTHPATRLAYMSQASVPSSAHAGSTYIRTIDYDYNFDGDDIFESRTHEELLFDKQDRLLRRSVEGDYGIDGIIENRIQAELSYDTKGNLLRYEETLDHDANGVADAGQWTAFTYDSRGNVLTTIHASDYEADGAINSSDSSTNRYGKRGWLEGSDGEWDSDGDGVPNGRWTDTYTYDSKGREVKYVHESDSNSDGIPDSRQVQIFAYDKAGNLAEVRIGAGGADGSFVQQYAWFTRFDKHRRAVHTLFTYDLDGDSILESSSTQTYTYDSRGNLLIYTYEEDQAANGSVDSRMVQTDTYDTGDHLLLSVRETDSGDDGTIDQIERVIYSYDQAGDLTQRVLEHDANADGTPEGVQRETYGGSRS